MAETIHANSYVGILLAAGEGYRFDSTGRRNKLLQVLPDGAPVVIAAARNVQAATGMLLVVVSGSDPALAAHISSAGYTVTECLDAHAGMSASLAHALRRCPNAPGWIIALGDMPFVKPSTVQAIVDCLAKGADIVVPVSKRRRGNPVGFSRRHWEALTQLSGDIGARKLLEAHPVQEVRVDDPGIFRDIDTVADFEQYRSSGGAASQSL